MSVMSNIQYLIYKYINHCFEEYGILPSEDDIYTRFQIHFDNGVPIELAEEEIKKFVSAHNLEDIEIRWEGKLDGDNFGRIKKNLEIPSKATR